MRTDSLIDQSRLQTVSRKDFWQRHVHQWRTSGLSKMAYCQQNGLTHHQMVYWNSKAEPVAEAKSPGGFVAVAVSSDEHDSSLSIRFPNGMSIEGISERSVDIVIVGIFVWRLGGNRRFIFPILGMVSAKARANTFSKLDRRLAFYIILLLPRLT